VPSSVSRKGPGITDCRVRETSLRSQSAARSVVQRGRQRRLQHWRLVGDIGSRPSVVIFLGPYFFYVRRRHNREWYKRLDLDSHFFRTSSLDRGATARGGLDREIFGLRVVDDDRRGRLLGFKLVFFGQRDADLVRA
jgi:hypothetical protein